MSQIMWNALRCHVDEEIPSGSIGCFIPVGRPGIYNRLAKIEEALRLQEEINNRLQEDNRFLKLEILENKEKTQKIMAQDFNNLVVQLVYIYPRFLNLRCFFGISILLNLMMFLAVKMLANVGRTGSNLIRLTSLWKESWTKNAGLLWGSGMLKPIQFNYVSIVPIMNVI